MYRKLARFWLAGVSGRYLGKGRVTGNPKDLPKYSPSSKPGSLSNFLAHMFIENEAPYSPPPCKEVVFLSSL